MSNESKHDRQFVRIELNPSQQAQVKAELGKDADALELTTMELEERIAPRMLPIE